MSTQTTKRDLLGPGLLLGAGALALSTQSAKAQTPFSSFSFSSALGNTARTMPARLSDFQNVKDYGAVGNGIADDTAAINSAIRALTSGWSNGLCGTIYFPPGNYLVSSPLLIDTYQGNHSIIMQGDGQSSSIGGNFADFIIKGTNSSTAGIVVIEKLSIGNNNAAGGGIQIYGTVNACIDNVVIGAYLGIYSQQGASVTMRNVQVVNSQTGWPSGSIGILVRGNAAIYTCDITSYETGIRMHGGAVAVYGGRFERNKTAITMGQGVTFGANLANQTLIDDQTSGSVISAFTMEANDTGIYAYDASGSKIGPGTVSGESSSPSGGSQYGLNLRSFGGGVIESFSVSAADASSFSSAGIYCGSITNTTFMAVGANSMGGGPSWKYLNSAGSSTIAGAQLFGCNNPDPGVIFALRSANPWFGQVAIFTDSTTMTPGALIAGGGSGRVLGVYGANSGSSPAWTVLAPG
jgi:hypothetical protein